MKKIFLALFLLAATAHADTIGPYVFRVCLSKEPTQYSLVAVKVETKVASNLCVTITSCEKADFDLYYLPSGTETKFKAYISKDRDTCR